MALTQVQGGMILASGQSIPSAALPVGSVLQVVQGSTQATVSTTSTTPLATGLTATITPKFTTSKVLVLISGGNFYTGAAVQQIGCYLYRNGSTPAGVSSGGFTFYYGNSSALQGSYSASFLDSPASTSAQTYSLSIASTNGGVSNVVSNGNSCYIYIQLLEIAG
jgi:hypothetical protein